MDQTEINEAVIEVAEAIGFATATIKAFTKPPGITSQQCYEATDKLEAAKGLLQNLLKE